MKRLFLGMFLAVVAFLAAGCTYSLRPFYLPGQQVFDDRLLGTWVVDHVEGTLEPTGTGTFEFTETEGNRLCRSMRDKNPEFVCPYHLVVRGDPPDGEEVGDYEAVLFSLDGKLFLDLSPMQPADTRKIAQMSMYLPLHVLIRILTLEPNLRISAYSGNRRTEEEDGLPTEMLGDDALYTASTKELQAFLLRHDESVLFDEARYPLRRKPAE
jgi:hypothetical protein